MIVRSKRKLSSKKAGGSNSNPPWRSEQPQHVSSSKQRSSIPHQEDALTNGSVSSSSDEMEPEPSTGRPDAQAAYLQGRVVRRTKYESTAAHAEVFEKARVYLLAFVVSGRAGDKSTP